MTPDDLLRLYPRETLRWLRRRLALGQIDPALRLGVSTAAVGWWESGRRGITPAHQAQIIALLAPHLTTPEGEAFVRSLGRGEE